MFLFQKTKRSVRFCANRLFFQKNKNERVFEQNNMKHITCFFDEAENIQSDSSNTVLKHCRVSCKSTEIQAQNISMTHDVPFSFSSSPFGLGVVWGWFCFCLVHFCFARFLFAKTTLRFLFLRSKTARAGLSSNSSKRREKLSRAS